MTLLKSYVVVGLIIAFIALFVDAFRKKNKIGLDGKDVVVIIFLWPLFLYFLGYFAVKENKNKK